MNRNDNVSMNLDSRITGLPPVQASTEPARVNPDARYLELLAKFGGTK